MLKHSVKLWRAAEKFSHLSSSLWVTPPTLHTVDLPIVVMKYQSVAAVKGNSTDSLWPHIFKSRWITPHLTDSTMSVLITAVGHHWWGFGRLRRFSTGFHSLQHRVNLLYSSTYTLNCKNTFPLLHSCLRSISSSSTCQLHSRWNPLWLSTPPASPLSTISRSGVKAPSKPWTFSKRLSDSCDIPLPRVFTFTQ